MSTRHTVIATSCALFILLSVGLPFDAYAQDSLSDHGYVIVEGRCGFEKIEYKVTNATLRSIEVGIDTVTVSVILEGATSAGTVVLKIPQNVLYAEYEVVVFADGEDSRYREINTTSYYRTIAIDFEPGTEEIEIVGESIFYGLPPCPAEKREITTLYVNVGNNTFPLGYYMSNGGDIEAVSAAEGLALTAIFARTANSIEDSADYYLDLIFPRELYDILALTEHDLIAFVDGNDASVEFIESLTSCDQIAVRIQPIQANNEELEIVYDDLPSVHSHNVPSRIDLMKTILVEGKDGKQDFGIRMVTDAIKCDASFVKEEKKIHIDVKGRSGSDKDSFFRLTVPHDLLGGNYTVLVDAKQVDFKEDTFFTNSNTDIGAEFVEDSRGIKASHLTFSYPANASKIDIIGTTAAPEFGSVVATFVMTLAIIGIIIAAKQFRKRQW